MIPQEVLEKMVDAHDLVKCGCGENPEVMTSEPGVFPTLYLVRCSELVLCGITTLQHSSRGKAEQAWNRAMSGRELADKAVAVMNRAVERLEATSKRADDFGEALLELVTLKDGKGKTISTEEYERRKPLAWAAARAALEGEKK